jgi:O-methyltransferase
LTVPKHAARSARRGAPPAVARLTLDAARRARRGLRRALRRLGYDVIRAQPPWPSDFGAEEIALCEEVRPYTMTSPVAIVTLADAVRDLSRRNIPGAFVECGVWKGGSMMAVARTLLRLGRTDAALYLFDTFEGMTPPTCHDVSRSGRSAAALLAEEQDRDTSWLWARAPLAAVQAAVRSVGYPQEQVHYVKGRVEDTLPAREPEQIALLSLDTDWYESTRHELEHLYPRLQPGGILIIDDYGWWGGAREATDEYFDMHPPRPFLVRVDDSGRRMAVKQAR